jgi:non-ribosomal peptide synthase protein (TIGR01720 family)
MHKLWILILYPDPAMLAELPAWETILDGGMPLIPGAALDPARDTIASASHLNVELPVRLTAALLAAVPAAFHARINDVLLAALAVAVAAWRRGRGSQPDGSVLVALEGHGREPMADGIDLARTVGWFTSLYPVVLDVGPIDLDEGLAGGAAMGVALKRVKEQLRAIPGRGLGYGLLRYLHPEARVRLAGRPEPQLGFNYLGRFAAGADGDWAPTGAGTGLGGGADPAMPLAHLVEVNALTVDGPQGPCLSATWTWAGARLDEREVRALAEAWRRAMEALARHVERPGAGGHTPSDFPLVTLSQEQMEQLEASCPALEDILPLSPFAGGVAVPRAVRRHGPDVYNVQIVVELEGVLDAGRLHAAAQALLHRHANLLASIRHEGLERPVQVIPRQVEVPWREVDLSPLEGEAQDERRAELLAADRAEWFVPTGPLLRWTLVSHPSSFDG